MVAQGDVTDRKQRYVVSTAATPCGAALRTVHSNTSVDWDASETGPETLGNAMRKINKNAQYVYVLRIM